MKIYTRRGDGGRTDLFGGERVEKSDLRVEAYGCVDELNAAVGLALGLDEGGGLVDAGRLERVQEDLFAVGARLAAAEPEEARRRGFIPDLPSGRVEDLEAWIDELEEDLPALDAFILPGGDPVGAQLHAARTVCRRAERRVTRLLEDQPDLGEAVLPYLNRLSDLLFTLARSANRKAGSPEARWAPQRERRGGKKGAASDGPGETGDGGEGAAGNAGDEGERREAGP